MKCNICGRFMRGTSNGWKCRVHPLVVESPSSPVCNVDSLTAEECTEAIKQGKTVEFLSKNLDSTDSTEIWCSSKNKTLNDFRSSMTFGEYIYRIKPEPIKVPEPINPVSKDLLTPEECMYYMGLGKVVELWVPYTSGMSKCSGKWINSMNNTLNQYKSSIKSGIKYRLLPEVITVVNPIEIPVKKVPKTLDDMSSAEVEVRMKEATEVVMKYGTYTKLESGKIIIIMEVD